MVHVWWGYPTKKEPMFPPKKQNAPGTKEFRKLDGDEIVKPKTVDKNIAKQLQQARCAKKLKQKEVAQRLNVPLSMIQNVENGKAKLNKAFLSNALESCNSTINCPSFESIFFIDEINSLIFGL